MADADVPPSGGECPAPGPFFADVATKLPRQDPEGVLRRYRFPDELWRICCLDLTAAEGVLSRAVRSSIAGQLGDYLIELLGRGFQYSTYLGNLIRADLARVANLTGDWHRFLEQAVTSCEDCVKNAREHILVAFNVVVDSTITLTGSAPGGSGSLATLVHEVARRAGWPESVTLQEARRRAYEKKNAKGGDLDKEAADVVDVLSLVIRTMRGFGPKPFVTEQGLQDWLIEYFGDPACGPADSSFGGAAGNEAYVLRNLGFPVLLYTPYHNAEQAAIAPDCAKRLVLDPAGPRTPFPPIHQGDPNAPRKYSFIFQVTPERDAQNNVVAPSLATRQEPILPREAQRVIFQLPYPKLAGTEWDMVKVDGAEASSRSFPGLTKGDWPWFPVFQHPARLESGVLTIDWASAGTVGSLIPGLRAALLGGLQRLGPEELRPGLEQAVVSQIQALKTPKFYELSGVKKRSDLDLIKQRLDRADVHHIGINREELCDITSEKAGSPYYLCPAPATEAKEDAFIVYARARKLFEVFGCQSLYVHDLELDILLIRDGDLSDDELARHRQAMLLAKVAVPLTLLRRARVQSTAEWDFLLSFSSLLALAAFASHYSREAGSGTARRNLMEKGYHREAGFAVVVAPAIYIKIPEGVSLSGAGDMCFAVRAAAISDAAFMR